MKYVIESYILNAEGETKLSLPESAIIRCFSPCKVMRAAEDWMDNGVRMFVQRRDPDLSAEERYMERVFVAVPSDEVFEIPLNKQGSMLMAYLGSVISDGSVGNRFHSHIFENLKP